MTVNDFQQPPAPAATHGHRLGLSFLVILALAMLAVPRVFIHDLGVDVGPAGAALLTIGPIAVWIVVVLRARVPSPVLTLMAVGALYGVALGLVHNLLWNEVFGDNPPTLGGLVDDDLAQVPLRVATFLSSMVTGVAVGAVSGLVATAIRWAIAVRR